MTSGAGDFMPSQDSFERVLEAGIGQRGEFCQILLEICEA